MNVASIIVFVGRWNM